MKKHPTPNRRAFVALLPATLLFAAPGFAQEVQTAPAAPQAQTVAPPPVVPTLPTTTDAAPAPVTPAAVPDTTDTTPATTAAPAAVEAPAPVARTVRAAPRVTRPVRGARAASEPVVATPVEAAPAAVTPASAPAAAAPAPETAAPAAPAPAAPVTTSQTTTSQGTTIWPWLLAGLVVLGALGLLLTRRRRVEPEEVYYEPAPILDAAPIVAAEPAFAPAEAPQFLRTAPIVAAPAIDHETHYEVQVAAADEHAELAEPEASEVAELTAGNAPADRPWLEFALRPVRAGVSADEALVEIELTVGNAGSVKAKDVRISTFMFASEPGSDDEMNRMLVERGDDGVKPVTIEPGEGTRFDATLALSKASLIETTNGSILPVVVADARYTLADGSEGRTSATFTIGVSEEGMPAMSPISLSERGMHDDVEARLHGVPEHA